MFNPFKKLDDEPQVPITINVDGQEQQAMGFLYRCEGQTQYGMPCRLVWDRAHLAKSCADHNHRNQYTQTYKKQDGTESKFLRQAKRRDGPRPSGTPAPVQAEPAPAPVPVLSLADLRQQALALGFRLSRIPQAKPVLKSVITELPDVEILWEDPDSEPAF